jgi:hypothetical protein
MSNRMDKIKEKLKKFAEKDLALRKAIAKRQDRKRMWPPSVLRTSIGKITQFHFLVVRATAR